MFHAIPGIAPAFFAMPSPTHWEAASRFLPLAVTHLVEKMFLWGTFFALEV
jgi:hypothetical protein